MTRTSVLVATAFIALATSAQAATVTFSGTGAASTDPLGGTTSISSGQPGATGGPNAFNIPTWGEDFANNGMQVVFNPSSSNNGFVATSFSFTYTGPQTFGINSVFDTGLTKIVETPPNTGAGAWDTTINGDTVTFTAPAAINYLNPGDEFDLIIGFTSAINPSTFSYTATWTGTESQSAPGQTPLPAALPMFLSGAAGFGGLLRWRKKRTQNSQPA